MSTVLPWIVVVFVLGMALAGLIETIRHGAEAMLVEFAIPLFLVGLMLVCLGTCAGFGVAFVRLVWILGG